MNYSESITKKLKNEKIEIGDKVKIVKKSEEFSGILMPKSQQGKKDTINLKLESGYNIGIKYDLDTEINKISSKEKMVEEIEEVDIDSSSDKKVKILSVGGTITSKIDYRTGAVKPAEDIKHLTYTIPEIFDIAQVERKKVLNELSENMRPRHWQKIAKEVYQEIKNGVDGIVITHGTDTMSYTASALSFMLKNLNIPVVLTGSQRSSDRGSSDAFTNLKCAIKAATTDIAEVSVCMHAESSDSYCYLHRGTKVRKMHTSNRGAFKSINADPLAKIDIDSLEVDKLNKDFRKRHDEEVKMLNGFEEKVDIIKSYPGLNPEVVQKKLSLNKGIVIEGSGLGHLPIKNVGEENQNDKIRDLLDNFVNNDGIAYMTSQCLNGRINMNIYETGVELQDIGVLGNMNDMLPETAWIKLGWLLGNFDSEKAKKLMNKNLRGEITQRTKPEGNR